MTSGFGWLAIVAPILVAAPSYFYGDMTFGKLMMVIGAFNQVQQALGWFANNFSGIADWRATLIRVVSFRSTLLTIDNLGEGQSRIELDGRHEESIVIDELRIATPDGCLTLSETHLEVKPGDHVLITGERDAERALFQAIAGLWPWGGGRIARPHRQSMAFMPTPGYTPPGTLREALAYPHPPQTYDDARIREAFAIVGLEHYTTMLDENERWDRRLNDNDKQCLAMARVLLQRPRWVVFNRALAALDPEVARRISAAFAQHMADVGVIYIGPLPNGHGNFPRVVNLVLDPAGPLLQTVGQGGGPRPARSGAGFRAIERFSISAFPDYTSAAPTPSPLMGEGWGGGENLLRFSGFPPPQPSPTPSTSSGGGGNSRRRFRLIAKPSIPNCSKPRLDPRAAGDKPAPGTSAKNQDVRKQIRGKAR